MAEAKTKPTKVAVADYIATIPEAERQQDAKAIAALMADVSGEPATMWGPAIVGFGRYAYTYDSGHSGETMLLGFAARKSEFALYGLSLDAFPDIVERLGKHKRGKGCLYLRKLGDVDLDALRELAAKSMAKTREQHAPK